MISPTQSQKQKNTSKETTTETGKSRQMSQTSIDAYRELETKLTEREQWVYEAVEDIAPCSIEQVAKHLKVGDNIVSGRMTGLKNKKKIVKAYRGLNSRGRAADFWVPAERDEDADTF